MTRVAARPSTAPLPPVGDGVPRVAVYLHPGQLHAGREPTTVTTILGSCVAVCLVDAGRKVGGVNHFLLPHWAGEGHRTPRFGNVAMELLLERLLAMGARRGELRAKVFGGACVLEAFHGPHHLGARNAEVAMGFLAAEGIEVAAADTGGRRGRKLLFRTDDGTALVKLI